MPPSNPCNPTNSNVSARSPHSPHTGDYVIATYRVRDKQSALEKRAESIAIGLTVGSWTDLPRAKQQEVGKHCGVVDAVRVLEEHPDGQVTAELSVGYPVINFTPEIAALLTTVFGKLSMDGEIKLVDLTLPDRLIRQFPGPKFGVAGVRQLVGQKTSPLLMSIFKSCIGSSLDELAAHFTEQALGQVDLIKDDEIFFTEAYATPEARVEAYAKAAEKVASETGRLVRYAVNLTGRASDLVERAKRLSSLGAGALLFNVFAYGYDLLADIAAHPDVQVPILAHPAVSGALYAAPTHGISSHIVLGQLLRLAGADLVLYPSPYGSVTLARAEGDALVEALRADNGLRQSFPVPSAGIHPGLVPVLMRDYGTDVVINAGGGIHGHPDGATAGGLAFRAAIDAVLAGTSLTEAAQTSPTLAKAITKWGIVEA